MRKKVPCVKIKFWGLTLFDMYTDNEEYFVFIKLFCGIIYFKYDIILDIFNFRLFGLLVFKTRLWNQYRVWWLSAFPIWIQNISRKFLRLFLNKVIETYPDYDDYYIFLSRSGEFFLLMHHFKELLHNNKSKKTLLVFTAKYHLNICKMFFPEIPCCLMKRINVPMVSKGVTQKTFEYKHKNIYVPMYEKYFFDVENKISNDSAHYYECLKQHLDLGDNIQHYQISEKTKIKIAKIAQYVLNNNFILISPETLSNIPMEKDFWNDLCKILRNQGFEIFVNAMNFYNLIPDTQSVFLTYEESIELSKYAKAIIGMRSGFLECLSQNNVPLFALYTDFPPRPGFKRLTSNKVLSGYSIKKLPHINKNLIFEYDVNEYQSSKEIIETIVSKILQIEHTTITKKG